MPNVWFCIPSIRPNGGTVPLWVEKGYRVCLVRQGPPVEIPGVVNLLVDRYHGWAPSVNMAVRHVLSIDAEADWFVAGGDDTEPDPNHTPDEIAEQCSHHFAMQNGFRGWMISRTYFMTVHADCHPTMGVMQPTGDLALWPQSRIDNFAGSPWMGREWCERAHQGNGPMDDRFHHMFGDECLQEVARKYGVFWQRPDLIHRHMHALRPGGGGLPEFLKPVNTPEHWHTSQMLFQNLKAAGWPGCEPLPVEVTA